MPFRERFDCLWCGAPHETRTPEDVEGWAQLCPTCIGRAGENGFLRFRLKAALAERARGTAPTAAPIAVADGPPNHPDRGMVEYYEARAPEYDDFYLRRGRYDRGSIANAVWQSELDRATLWLDSLPLGPVIVELAAGTGWWSPLLAQKGELWAFDAAEAPLDRARSRLLAHRLRAHLHVRDAWAEPDREVDSLFAGFWLSHVPRADLASFLALVRRWLRPGGTFAFIDSLPDPESGAADHPSPADDRSVRRLSDGREFEITKVYYTPVELEAALGDAGFGAAEVTTTGRFFLLGRATTR
ncbi:MAG TPA: class I SAM-dependent methyltransferase [Candidatus Limnocylindrales bacterium]|nr:class I SAM-dependent methyltransferase [Candidatus Limnocylindrales bacterium]